MDKILRINMGADGGPKAVEEPVGRYRSLGGRAMTTTVIWEEVTADCDPLGADNKIVISPGFMTGSSATTSGRMSIGCKSPLTGGIKESNVGGQAGTYLGRLGYAAVILEGSRTGQDIYKVVIRSDGVSLTECNQFKMAGNYALAEAMQKDHGGKVAMISIGTAGEMGLANSGIAVTDPEFRPTRHAARGGCGAVMGSKGIKAIIVDPAGGTVRKPADPEGFKAANRALVETLRKAEYTGEILPALGTAVVADITNEMGGYPALGASQGRWEHVDKLSGPAVASLETERGGKNAATHGCHRGCAIRCSGLFHDKNGKYITKQPEYETLWSHGGYCGIHDLDAIARMDRLDDDLGLDTIEMGCTIGVLMQAGELEWGDSEGALAVIEEIGKGTDKGRLFGSGTAAVARHYGVERAPVVKGQAMAAYDPRALKGLGVTYATSPQGADHTAGQTLANHLHKADPKVDALATENQWLASAVGQIASAAFDATGYCLFVAFATMDRPEALKYLLDSMTTFTGTNWNENNFPALGIRVLRMELDFNRRAGFTAADDKLPEWMMKEPLPPHNSVFDVPAEDLAMAQDHIGVLLTMLEGVNMAFAPPMAFMGEGVHKLVPVNLAALGVTRALIVTDKGVESAGLLKILTDAMDEKYVPYSVYSGVEPNPTIHNVNHGLNIYRDEGCDGIVSLGGGSPHDCAKAIGVMVNNTGSIHDYQGLFAVMQPLPPLVAVTTTSGTGSEASFAAIISDPERKEKMGLGDPKMIPIVAVNDPLLTRTMPPHITAGTGMDAMTHAVEAYISRLSNPYSDGLALQAIELIAANLPRAVEKGDDMAARTNMCYAQYNAGLAMNSAQLGCTHALAHSLGGVYNLPHGDCNALLLPTVMRKNKDVARAKLARVAALLGVDTTGMSEDEAADAAADAMEALNAKVGILPSIEKLAARYGCKADRADLDLLVGHAAQDPTSAANPRPFSPKDYRDCYEAVWAE